MKEQINLIPPWANIERHQRLVRQRLGALLTSLLLAFLSINLALIGAAYVNSHSLALLKQAMDSKASNAADATARVLLTNTLVTQGSTFQSSQVFWTPLAVEAISKVPPDMHITEVTIDASQNLITLEGKTTNRPNVVVLESSLRALPWVGSLDAPLQNFAASPETSFSFTMHYLPPRL